MLSLAFALALLAQPGDTRSCRAADWRFAFGKCHEEKRNVYPYVRFCDPAGVQPRPLLNVSCRTSCLAGEHLGVQLEEAPEIKCLKCPAGKFSLGGGLLISGVAGDWHSRWPVGLRSSCSFRRPDGTWEGGHVASNGLSGVCEMQVLAPEPVAGSYLLKPLFRHNRNVESTMAMLLLAPGDRRLCSRVTRKEIMGVGGDRLLQGFFGQRPGNQGRRTLSFWLLAAAGGCSRRAKSAVAAAAGAEGVVLAPSAALAVGAGGVAPPAAFRSGTNDTQRRVPAFLVLEDQDAQLLASGLKHLSEGIILNNTAMHSCSLPQTTKTDHEDQPEGTVEYGCNSWTPDELGLTIHSGENHKFHRLVSTLELAVNIVRDHGYVLFRYQVDSEEGYDGLSLEVDWNEVMPRVSVQASWRDLRVNLTKGSHLLRWQYAKDYSTSSGMDRAQLQLVQLVGTAMADLECFDCHGSGTHSAGGADHCNACGRDEYLNSSGADLSKCRPCPAGKWSHPGALSLQNCHPRHVCTAADVKVSLTPCAGGKQRHQRSWLQPVKCDVNASGAPALLVTHEAPIGCLQCEPNFWRPSGGPCEPNLITCLPGQFAVTELILSRWLDWPRNLSQQVFLPSGEEEGTVDVPGGWRLLNGTGVGLDPNVLGQTEARLNLDVQMLSPGHVNFTLEMPTELMWGADLQFLVDAVEALHLPNVKLSRSAATGRLQVFVPLWTGQHRLTWRSVHPTMTPSFASLRLIHVVVQGADGAGASRCARCPPGQEVTAQGTSCRSCAPGSFLQDAERPRCNLCSKGSFSSNWGATECLSCGPGTDSNEGALLCRPKAILKTTDHATASQVLTPQDVVVNATAALEQWQLATAGLTGPFLVAGRKFLISLLRPIEAPEDDGEAFVWELTGQECQANSSGATSTAAAAMAAAPAKATAIGIKLTAVEAVAQENIRGVKFHWAARSNTSCSASMGSVRPEDLSGVSLMLRCDTMAQLPAPAARQDPSGNVHLDNLRLAGARYGVFSTFACNKLELEWPTLMACPPCHPQDFAIQRTPCQEGQWRTVTFKLMRPCLGGMQAPPGYQETCDGKDVKSIVTHAGETVRQKYPLRALTFASVTVLLGCVLLCYATFLHRKYRHLYMQDGGL